MALSMSRSEAANMDKLNFESTEKSSPEIRGARRRRRRRKPERVESNTPPPKEIFTEETSDSKKTMTATISAQSMGLRNVSPEKPEGVKPASVSKKTVATRRSARQRGLGRPEERDVSVPATAAVTPASSGSGDGSSEEPSSEQQISILASEEPEVSQEETIPQNVVNLVNEDLVSMEPASSPPQTVADDENNVIPASENAPVALVESSRDPINQWSSSTRDLEIGPSISQDTIGPVSTNDISFSGTKIRPAVGQDAVGGAAAAPGTAVIAVVASCCALLLIIVGGVVAVAARRKGRLRSTKALATLPTNSDTKRFVPQIVTPTETETISVDSADPVMYRHFADVEDDEDDDDSHEGPLSLQIPSNGMMLGSGFQSPDVEQILARETWQSE